MQSRFIDLDSDTEGSDSPVFLTPASSQASSSIELPSPAISKKRSFSSLHLCREQDPLCDYSGDHSAPHHDSRSPHSEWKKLFAMKETQATKNKASIHQNVRDGALTISTFFPITKTANNKHYSVELPLHQKRCKTFTPDEPEHILQDATYYSRHHIPASTMSKMAGRSSTTSSRTVFPEPGLTASGTENDPWEIDSGDEDELAEAFSTVRKAENRQKHYETIIDDDDEVPELTIVPGGSFISEHDYVRDEDLEELLHRLHLDSKPHKASVIHVSGHRTPIPECRTPSGKSRLFPGKVVEFISDGTFMHIKSLAQDDNGSMWLNGNLFKRCRRMARLMPRRANELASLNDIHDNDDETVWSEVERPLDDVLKVRLLFKTNQQYPKFSWLDHPNAFGPDAEGKPTMDNEHGPLFCRWRYVTKMVEGKLIEQILHDSILGEAEPGYDIRAEDLRKAWYGELPAKGGSHIKTEFRVGRDGKSYELVDHGQYTFGDAFCGGGGASRGALQADLFVAWGFDFEEKAIRTYRMNFEQSGTRCLYQAVDDFIRSARFKVVRVDVLHLSPPCQPFSPAHTVPSPEQDERNQAALLSTMELLKIVKPRVVIMEETEGLFNRHYEWFAMLIHIFNEIGYSIRWKVIPCKNYGIPQDRRRLCIIAAAPGERLPPFPKPTHGPPGSGLLPYVTVAKAITHLKVGDPDHDPIGTTFKTQRVQMPFDPHTTLAKTLTCGGGVGNYHPSGRRPYTIREAACLQTLPMEHKFHTYGARKQIGNMVPPFMEKVILQEVIKSLKTTDGVA